MKLLSATFNNFNTVLKEQKMSFNWATFGDDLLKDALLGGALASEIFVKNPNSQNEAARLLAAANTLIGTITSQLDATSASATPVSTPVQVAAPAVSASAAPTSTMPGV